MYLKRPIPELICCAFISLMFSMCVFAQGQDGTRSERDIMILSSLFSGRFDNSNQAYFDIRRNVESSEQHKVIHKKITELTSPEIGSIVYFAQYFKDNIELSSERRLYTMEVDYQRDVVRMKTYFVTAKAMPANLLTKNDIRYAKGCDLLWQQEAGQFHGRLEQDNCALQKNNENTPYSMLLSQDALWIRESSSPSEHYALDRTRTFACYIDMPGVGGGRDIPYQRFHIDDIHDRGGEVWTTIDDGTEIGIRLQNVQWLVNNYKGVFTRPSFVIYVKQKNGEEIKELSYGWTEPSAQRIGLNLKWMLVSCYMQSNEEISPFYKEEPKL